MTNLIRCLDCIHCVESEKKCYPDSPDCGKEYDLEWLDIYVLRDKDCDYYEFNKGGRNLNV